MNPFKITCLIEIFDYKTLLSEQFYRFENNIDHLVPLEPCLTMNISLEKELPQAPTTIFIDDGPDCRNVDEHLKVGNIFWTPSLVIQKLENQTKATFLMKENVYLGYACVTSHTKAKGLFPNDPICQVYQQTPYQKLNFKGHFDLCIGFCHTSSHTFGHIMNDYIPIISLLPKYLLKEAYVVTAPLPNIENYFALVGIDPSRVIQVGWNDYAFTRHLITLPVIPLSNTNLYFHKHFRNILKKKFNMDKTKPFRYVVFLRYGRRRVFNTETLFERVQKYFPNQEWELYKENEKVHKVVKYFNEIALLFCVHGSGEANCIFMQKGTAVSELNSMDYNGFYYTLLVGIGINYFIVRDTNLSHFGTSLYPIPEYQIKTVIEAGLRTINKTIMNGKVRN